MRRWQSWGRAELPAGSVGVAMSPWQEWMVALGSPGWQVSWAVAPRVLAMYLGWFVELRGREGAASLHFSCAHSHLHPQSPPLEAWPFISAPPRPLVLPAALPRGALLPTTVFPNRWPCVTSSPPSHLPPWGPHQLQGAHQLWGAAGGDTGGVAAKWVVEAGGTALARPPHKALSNPGWPALLAPLCRPGQCACACMHVCVSVCGL